MDNVIFLWIIIIALLFSFLVLMLSNGDISDEQEKEIIKRYRKSRAFQEEISKLVENKFQHYKEDFLREQEATLSNTSSFKSEAFANVSFTKENIEKPNFDFSDVKFIQEVEQPISKDELLEVIDKREVKKIDRKFLFPKKEVEDTSSEFYRKKVVITGDFKYFQTRNQIAEILYNLGADIDTSVTEKTDYLIKGEKCGWSKEAKAIDFGVIIYTEQVFLQKIKN